jgi:hypothetical protein
MLFSSYKSVPALFFSFARSEKLLPVDIPAHQDGLRTTQRIVERFDRSNDDGFR